MKTLDCVFFGSATFDILMLVAEPPRSDARIAASRLAMACGGPAGTACVGFHRLGGRAGLISAVGDDDTGDTIAADLESHALALLQLHRLEGERSSLSAIQVEADGKRCITHFGGCIDRLDFAQVDKAPLHRARVVHIAGAGEHLAVPLARYCKEHTGALVSVDGGNYSRALTDAILPHTDIFIPDDKTARNTLGLGPEDACRYYRERGPRTVCVTCGPAGSVALDGEEFLREPAFDVEVLDTTGAGDNFHGAFLYGVVQGWPPARTLRFASIFSSMTCRGLGGREAIPSRKAVLAAL